MVHLCSGYVIHNYLLGPRVVLDPISSSYPVLLRRHTRYCSIYVAGNVTVGEDTVHPLLPVVPVVVRQVAPFREPIYCRVFLSTYQSNGWIVGSRWIGSRWVGSQWVSLSTTRRHIIV